MAAFVSRHIGKERFRMRVLITGAAGLTGSYLVRHCLEQGDTVVAVSYTHLDVYKRQGKHRKQKDKKRRQT